MAEKYNITFEDDPRLGNTWLFEIHQDGFGGSPTAIKLEGSPLSINWGGVMFEKGGGCAGSRLNLNIFSETNFALSDLWNSDYMEYTCLLKKNGTTWWRGIQIVEDYSEPYTDTPYPSKLTFSCGLGHLRDIRYDNSGTLYTGISSLIQIFVNCLEKTPFSLPVREIVNFLEDQTSETAANWLLNTTYLYETAFRKENKETKELEGWTCYEVLDEICKALGAVLYQFEDKWYLTCPVNSEATTAEMAQYTAGATSVQSTDLSFSTRQTVSHDVQNGSLIWFNPSGSDLGISEQFNIYKTKYDYQTFDLIGGELITDWNLKRAYNESSAADRMKFWDLKGVTAGTHVDKVTILDSQLGLKPVIEFNETILDIGHTNFTKWIQPLEDENATDTYDQMSVTTDDSFIISFAGRFYMKSGISIFQGGALNMSEQFISKWYIQVKLGTYYLSFNGNGALSWTTTVSYIYKERKSACMNADYKWFNNSDLWEFGFDFDMLFQCPGFPQNGQYDLDIKIFMPEAPVMWSGNLTADKFHMDKVSILVIDDDDLIEPIETSSTTGDADIRNREKKFDYKFGDGPHQSVTSSFLVDNGSYKEATDAWFRRGAPGTTYSHVRFFHIEQMGRYWMTQGRRNLSHTILGELEIYKAVADQYGIIYFINGVTFDPKKGLWKVKLEEVNRDLGITLTIDESSSTVPKSNIIPTGIGTSTNEIDPTLNEIHVQELLQGGKNFTNVKNIHLDGTGASIQTLGGGTTDIYSNTFPGGGG